MQPVEHTDKGIALVLLLFGAFLLIFGLTSFVIRGKLFLSTAVVALLFGIALGHKGAESLLWILPGSWEEEHESDQSKSVLLWFTRIVLGIQVLAAGVTLPPKVVLRPRIYKSLMILLGPVMVFAVVSVALFAKLLLPAFGWLECFVIAACLAPTDPVLAASVVKGTFAERHVPPYIQDLLLCESGINDGAGTPYFLLFLLPLVSKSPVREYFLMGILWETLFPVFSGFVVGTVFRLAWTFAKKRHWVDKESRLVWTIALALFTLGLFELIGSNELLACYVCGTAMNWDGALHEDDMHTHFSEGIDAILDASVFTTLGTVLPWSVWLDPESPVPILRLVGFGVLVIAFRRLPAVLALHKWIPQIRTLKEGFFVGWFGPMGIGAVYYALKAAESLPADNVLKQQLFGIISWIVFTSTLVHGTTLPFFLLGSSIHPSFHPKFLVQDGVTTEPSENDTDEGTRLLRDENAEEGETMERAELDKILKGESSSTDISDELRENLLGESQLKNWGRGRVSVYDEGSCLIICDEEGNVSVRRVRTGKKSSESGVEA